jgi:hypothetical protein
MKIAIAIAIAVLIAIAALAASTEAAGPPTATTGTGSGSLSCSADIPSHLSMSGTVNPNGQDTTYSFQYGVDTTYGSQTTAQDAGSGTSDVAVSADVTGVGAGTIHFRLVAAGGGTTVYGDDHTANVGVPPCPPPPMPRIDAKVLVTLGCDGAGATASAQVTITPVMSTHELGATASIGYGTGPAAILPADHQSAGVRVSWSTANFAPATVTIAIGPVPSRSLNYELILAADDGGELVTPISDVSFSEHGCPARGTSRSIATSVTWKLVSRSARHRTATISFQPPCGATKDPAHISVTRLSRHRARIAVTMRVSLPASSCITLAKRQQRTIHLPRGTTAAQLVHAR